MARCSSGTRIVGCILVFALVVQLYIDMEGTKISFGRVKTFVMDMLKAPKKILSVLVCPLGAFAYMAFLNSSVVMHGHIRMSRLHGERMSISRL